MNTTQEKFDSTNSVINIVFEPLCRQVNQPPRVTEPNMNHILPEATEGTLTELREQLFDQAKQANIITADVAKGMSEFAAGAATVITAAKTKDPVATVLTFFISFTFFSPLIEGLSHMAMDPAKEFLQRQATKKLMRCEGIKVIE
ncbi:MAG TPA: hypothetical protein PK370_03065 [Candidatus Woesebacteria bacterium]|nr:hypothetical protein [Candidatus Woesebacteria bacterium]